MSLIFRRIFFTASAIAFVPSHFSAADSLSPVTEAADTFATISEGRGDMFVFAAMALAVIAFVIWQNYAQRKTSETREESNANFYRDLALRNAEQMDVNNDAVVRVANAIESICETHKLADQSIAQLHRLQLRDRRSIACVIDATDAFHRSESEQAIEQLRIAREHLVAGEAYDPSHPLSQGS